MNVGQLTLQTAADRNEAPTRNSNKTIRGLRENAHPQRRRLRRQRASRQFLEASIFQCVQRGVPQARASAAVPKLRRQRLSRLWSIVQPKRHSRDQEPQTLQSWPVVLFLARASRAHQARPHRHHRPCHSPRLELPLALRVGVFPT